MDLSVFNEIIPKNRGNIKSEKKKRNQKPIHFTNELMGCAEYHFDSFFILFCKGKRMKNGSTIFTNIFSFILHSFFFPFTVMIRVFVGSPLPLPLPLPLLSYFTFYYAVSFATNHNEANTHIPKCGAKLFFPTFSPNKFFSFMRRIYSGFYELLEYLIWMLHLEIRLYGAKSQPKFMLNFCEIFLEHTFNEIFMAWVWVWVCWNSFLLAFVLF